MGDEDTCDGGQHREVIEPPIPLVWAKLRPPRLPARAVPRQRLIEELAGAGAALTAIVAPPGYGKTTTAVQLAEYLGDSFAWVSLEVGDDDPARFWTYVAAALVTSGVAGADATYAHLADGRDGLDAAMLTLRAAIEAHPEPVVLVLDDMQALGSETIERQLGDWLRHPLDNLRLIATSRSDLGLPVGRLRSQGLLTEARVEQLAFDNVESATLLGQSFGLSTLTQDQLDALDARTEGWPVGLYLAGLTLRDDPDIDAQLDRFTGDTRHLTEYLSSEAMDGVSPDVRAFVLATSIVGVLHPDLCDALTGQVGSLGVLRGLVAENVFTSALDESATIFQYHPLFREHLRSALLAEHPEQMLVLHARASHWFEARGEIDEAIVHASEAGDVERAESLIASASMLFSNAGHFGTIVGWINGIGPAERLTSFTDLLMAWIMLNLHDYDGVRRWLDLADLAAKTDAEKMVAAVQRPTIMAHKSRHAGDVGGLLTWSEAAVVAARAAVDARLPEEDDAEDNMFVRSDAGFGASMSVSGSAAFWAGDLAASREHMQTALTIARGTGIAIEIVFCYIYLAMIEAESGDPETALAHADQALQLVGSEGERHHQPALGYLARSIALLRLGRPRDAAVDLQDARRVAAMRTEPLHDAAIELQESRLHHLLGDSEAARASVRVARGILEPLPDPRFGGRLREVENEIRFVARDVDDLPIGARELTDREQSVLALLPHGLSRRELAAQLHVSENTIKTHLTSIRHKLGVSGRASVVERARDLGMLAEP